MKKITLVLAFIGMITLNSCTVNEDNGGGVDRDTISEVFRYNNVNFMPNGYSVMLNFPYAIYESDMALVYRLDGFANGNPIWKLLPETYYFDDGTLSHRYDFNFTRFDAEVYLEGYNLWELPSEARLNQSFRVVIIPGFYANKMAKPADFSDYNAVIKHYNIDDTKEIVVK
jgi:hypothetical protein